MAKPRRTKRKVRVKQTVRIIEKNDATRAARPDTAYMRKAPIRLAGDNGANFKVKIRKKQ